MSNYGKAGCNCCLTVLCGCTGSDAWKQHPTAVDAWSFGIMLLELAAGKLFSWVAPLNQLVFLAGRLDAAVQLSREQLPSGDAWFDGVWQLVTQLLDTSPDKRPSMDAVLMSDFFTSDKYAPDTSSTPVDRKFRMLNSHLDALRHSSNRLPAHFIRVQSEQTVLADMVAAFADQAVPLGKVFYINWGPNSVRKPLQEVMDIFLIQLGADQTTAALFQQCDETRRLWRSFLPPKQAPNATRQQHYQAVGRILAKCLLEGIHVPISFSAALHSVLVHNETLSSNSDECIAMMADFDPDVAQRLRQVLAAHHGDGSELMLTVGSMLGSSDETMVTDANKEEIICLKVLTKL